MIDNLINKENQTNAIREIYRIKGDSFDTQLICARGIQEITMMLYIAYLRDKNQPIFLDKTATVTKLGSYFDKCEDISISRSKEYKISFLLEKGKETFIEHDKEIDKKELDNLPKEENKN